MLENILHLAGKGAIADIVGAYTCAIKGTHASSSSSGNRTVFASYFAGFWCSIEV